MGEEIFLSADLHCHTRISDGSVGIDELVAIAKRKGLHTIAVTDHDTFAGATRAKIIGERHGVEVILGAEISDGIINAEGSCIYYVISVNIPHGSRAF